MPDTIEKTPAQLAAEQKLADAKAARIKQVADIRAKRAELEKNIGKVFTDGEREVTVESLDKNNIKTETGWLTDDYFMVSTNSPGVSRRVRVEDFLNQFKPKGAE